MLWPGHHWSGNRCEWGKELVKDGGRGVVIYAVKMCLACGLMLKKKLLHLMVELVVIFNHLGVIHLWRPHWPILWPPHHVLHPLHLQNWRIDLFKSKRICRHETNFKIPHVVISFPWGHHKCMVPYIFAVYEFSALEKVIILLFERNKLNIKVLLKDISTG